MFETIKKYKANLMIKKSVKSLEKGDFDSALKLIEDLLKIFPKCEKALYLKGRIYQFLGEYNKSLTCYDDIIHINPKYFFVWVEKALLLSSLKKYDDALKVLNEGLSININNQELIELKVKIFRESGRYDEGLEYANHVLNDINKELGMGIKASVLMAMGSCNDAYGCFYSLYDSNKKNISACFGLSSASYCLGNLEDAIDFLKKCIELNNDNLMFHLLYASYLIENKSYNHALDILNETLKSYADFNFYYLKGLCLEFLNKEEDAQKYYEKGLNLALVSLEAYNDESSSEMISVILERLNSPDEAKKYFDKFKKLNSRD